MDWFIYYLLAINIIGVVFMGRDKGKARSGTWRISEKNLLLVALAGGSVGIYLGIKLFRHKTRHLKFTLLVPVIFFVQIGTALFLVYKG